jgi:GlpG protein
VGNTAYILLLGPRLEEKYGSDKILKVILLTAVITGLVNFILFPTSALCGASGVVFAFILLTSVANFRQGEIPLTFILVAVVFIGQQVANGIFVRDNISNLSHIIGGLVGAAAGYALNSNRR